MQTPKANPQPRIRLTDARNERKLSQQQVADRIGTTHVNVSRWERGITKPSPYFRRKLSQLFGKTEEELDLVASSHTSSKPSSRPVQPVSIEADPVLPSASTGVSSHQPVYDPTIPLLPTVPVVGREQAVSNLKQRLCSDKNVLLAVLHGLPGVGKTTLASTLAHDPEIRAYFSDGILWAGLGPEPSTSNILSHWGTLLGISTTEMADLNDLEAWAIAIRRTIGSRRMLLVIDDAWSLKDARTFRVGGSNCAHLITTRYASIASQAGTDGAISISELNENESMQLLRLLAPRVVEREEQKSRDLVHAVGGLPLALNLIGNYLRMHMYTGQERRIDAALTRLSDAEERLDIGEPHGLVDRHTSLPLDKPISLKSIIAVSDQRLNPQESAALHALSVFPAKPSSFSEEAALAVAACDVATLDALMDAGLLEISETNHYTLHQTVADYAHSCLEENIPARDAAFERLIIHIMHFVESHKKDYETLELESTSILAALEAAHKLGKGPELIRCIYAFTPYLLSRGLYTQAEKHLHRVYKVATSRQDHYGIASALLYLGEIAQKQANYEQASIYLQEGLDLARQVKDNELISKLLKALGSVFGSKGDYAQSEAYLQEGLVLARQTNDREQMSALLLNLGATTAEQGNYAQAEKYYQEGLELARQLDDHEQICVLLMNLGATAGEQGKYVQAEKYYQEGLTQARKIGHRERISALLSNLGDALNEQGSYTQAEKYFQEGLILARQIGHRELISLVLLNLGVTARKQGNFTQAEIYFQDGLALARQIGIPQIIGSGLYEHGNLYIDQDLLEAAKTAFREILITISEGGQDLIALAHYGLARIAQAQGDINESRRLGGLSVMALEVMGNRKAKEVRYWLASLNGIN